MDSPVFKGVDALISGGCGGVDGGSYAWSKNFIVI